MRIAYLAAMDELRIDVLAIPNATCPPRVNGDRDMSTAGTLSGTASALHWPAAVVPMGYTYENLPSGLQLIGRPWSEPILIEIAYAYEQANSALRSAEYRPATPRSTERRLSILLSPFGLALGNAGFGATADEKPDRLPQVR